MDKYSDIVNLCIDKISHLTKTPLLIAITGDSGSGKSHFSNLFREELTKRGKAFAYINHDEFLIPRKDREPMKTKYYETGEFTGKSYWEILENMFYLDTYQSVIDSLKQNKPATYYPYLRETGDVSKETKTITPENLIIFDTTMMIEHMDFVILIDVTRENIIKRKIKRDSDLRTPEQIIEMHQKVQGYYWDRKKPQDPNIIIDNNDFDNPKIIKG